MHHYCLHLLKDPNRADATDLVRFLNGSARPALEKQGASVFGIFHGLFGLASNELYLVANSEDHQPDVTGLFAGFSLLDSVQLVPTVRPTDHSPRQQPGLYVFRWFSVHTRDIDEIAALSDAAWKTFEGGFDTQVQGLFAEPDRSQEQGKMLLLTWYKNLTVWQDSRKPPPEATENFAKRHQLTLEARPVATRLVMN